MPDKFEALRLMTSTDGITWTAGPFLILGPRRGARLRRVITKLAFLLLRLVGWEMVGIHDKTGSVRQLKDAREMEAQLEQQMEKARLEWKEEQDKCQGKMKDQADG